MADEYSKAKNHNKTYVDHGSYRTHNLNYDSPISVMRDAIKNSTKAQTFENERKIAKVVKVEQISVDGQLQLVNRVLIEIPGRENDGLLQDELATDPSKQNSSLYNHRYFYPADFSTANTEIKVGDWIWVDVPHDWPKSHLNSAESEGLNSNLYYGKVNGFASVIDESTATATQTFVSGLQSALAGVASAIGSILSFNAPTSQEEVSGQDRYKLYPPLFSVEPSDLLTSPFPSNLSFKVTSAPYQRVDPIKTIGTQDHMAIDFACPDNSPIIASNDGILVTAGFDKDAGNYVKILHNNKFYTKYLHLNSLTNKKIGSPIKRGELIGYSGHTGRRVTGPHLHFEVRDINNRKTNPLYLWAGGSLQLIDGKQISGLPFKAPPQAKVATAAAKPQAPVLASNSSQQTDSNKKTKGSPFSTKPRMSFLKYNPDFALYNKQQNEIGSNVVVLREDVKQKIDAIKEILNYYGVALSMNYVDNSLDNPNTSAYAKLGLEVNLNKFAALNPNNNLNFNDYHITFNNDNSMHPTLNVWAKVSNNFEESFKDKKPEKMVLEVLDISNSFKNKTKPETKKINGYFINLSKLFNENGFYHVNAGVDFYKYSDYTKSNWWIFYSHEKLYKNAPYVELLESLYELSESEKILANNIVWNGKDFV